MLTRLWLAGFEQVKEQGKRAGGRAGDRARKEEVKEQMSGRSKLDSLRFSGIKQAKD